MHKALNRGFRPPQTLTIIHILVFSISSSLFFFQVMEIFIWTSHPLLKTPLYWLPLSRMCTSGHPNGKAASVPSMAWVWRRETTFTTVNPRRQSPSWAALKPCWILKAFSTLTKCCQTTYTNSLMVFMISMKNYCFILPQCFCKTILCWMEHNRLKSKYLFCSVLCFRSDALKLHYVTFGPLEVEA